MPRLKNHRHEAFAQACAIGMSASDAYRATYGTNSKNADVRSCQLSGLVNVSKRIEELQAASEHITHMTIEEKRSIYAKEARDSRNALSARLAAIKDDSELAKHIRVAPSQAGSMSVTVNVVSLTEERRRELMEKKQRAIEWQKLSETRRPAIDHV